MSEKGFDYKGGNYFIRKDEWVMYAWLGLMYEFFFWIFLKTKSNWFLFHYYFEFMESFLWSNQFTNKHSFNHFFLKHYLNDMHEIAKDLKRFGWGDED